MTCKIIQRGLDERSRLKKLRDKLAASVDKFMSECIASGATVVTNVEFTNPLVND